MKKHITLAAASLLAASALTAQAQITLDGTLSAAEIATTATYNKYNSVGAFTTPHISTGGFGNWGLLRLYVGNGGANNGKLYFAAAGTAEKSGNNFQMYFDLPNVSGLPSGQPLAVPTPFSPTGGTVFDGPGGNMNGSGVADTKMDMSVDMAIALKGDAGGMIPQAMVYTSTAAATSRELSPVLPLAGTNVTLDATTTVGPFARLAGARMAYKDTPTGDITTNPGNTTAGTAGSFGWEMELDRRALGLPNTASIIRVMVAYVSGDGYWSSDVIPEIPGNANTNLERMPDFTAKAGNQAATMNVTLSNKVQDEATVAMSVFPNPSSSEAAVTYRVLDRAQNVSVILTDLMGRPVRTLHTGIQDAGYQTLNLGRSDLAAGTYLVKVTVGEKVATRKVVLL